MAEHSKSPQSSSKAMHYRVAMSEESRSSPGLFVGGLVAAFGLWLIVGAIAYTTPNIPPAVPQDFQIVMVATVIPVAFIVIYFITLSEYQNLPGASPKASSSALFISLMFYTWISVAFCIATSGQRTLMQHVFVTLSIVNTGIFLEARTCLVTGLLRSMDTSS